MSKHEHIEQSGATEEALRAEWAAFHQREAIDTNDGTPPANAITADHYAEINGITKSSAFALLARREQAGKLASGMFRVPSGRTARYFWKKEEEPCPSAPTSPSVPTPGSSRS